MKKGNQLPEQQAYLEKVKQYEPKSNTFSQCVKAFIVGGLICCLGQLIWDIGNNMFTFTESQNSGFTSIVLIFLGALFTGIGIYDKLGSFAGAGSIVPITGFSNAIVSSAMEHKREGHVLGVSAKMFLIAGPVLVYGISASVVLGIVYFLFGIA